MGGGGAIRKLDEIKVHDASLLLLVGGVQKLKTIFRVEREDIGFVISVYYQESATSFVSLGKPDLQIIEDSRSAPAPRDGGAHAKPTDFHRWHTRVPLRTLYCLRNAFKSSAWAVLSLNGIVGNAEERYRLAILMPRIRYAHEFASPSNRVFVKELVYIVVAAAKRGANRIGVQPGKAERNLFSGQALAVRFGTS